LWVISIGYDLLAHLGSSVEHPGAGRCSHKSRVYVL
jgi:hypothetical protein